jgi:hypothetical protein
MGYQPFSPTECCTLSENVRAASSQVVQFPVASRDILLVYCSSSGHVSFFGAVKTFWGTYFCYYCSEWSWYRWIMFMLTVIYRMSSDFVTTSGSYSWCYYQSEMSYEHRSNSQQFQSYGQKLKMIWTTKNTITDILPAWWGTLNSFLTDGLVMVDRRIGHFGHQAALP